jgi:uncharacterized metal-binding protein YceD (DUF177 family)
VESLFVINVHDVPEHAGTWSFVVPRTWVAVAFKDAELEPVDEEGSLEVSVSPSGKEFLVEGGVRVVLAGTCVRCLRPVPVVLDTSFSVLYVPGPVVEKANDDDEEKETDDGPDVEHFHGDRIVLDTYVRDTVLLEVPMNPKCQVECRLPERPQGVS